MAHRIAITLSAAVVILAGAAACGSTATRAASSSAPGVTSKQITIGAVTALTGPASADFYGNSQGAEARILLQNALGGVDGRRLNLVVGDDASNVQGGETAVSDLVEQKHAFGLLFLSGFVSAGYRTAQHARVPVVGWAIDGPEWGVQPNTNMVAVEGDVSPENVPNTLEPNVARLVGATNLASLAIGGQESSTAGAQAFTSAAEAIGLKVGYRNYSIPVGTVNVTAVVLAMQQAHVDGFASFMLDTTDFAVISGARQAGLNLVAPISMTGYGQPLLSDATALTAAQGAIFYVFQTPFEQHTNATEAERAAFAKYEHFRGVPNLSWTAGWTAADLFISGLEAAGPNLTRSSFLDALHKLKGWTSGGLLPMSPDFSLAHFGQAAPTTCEYFVRLRGSMFVPLNSGKPICGHNVD